MVSTLLPNNVSSSGLETQPKVFKSNIHGFETSYFIFLL